MAEKLETLLRNGKLKTSYIILKVVKRIDEEMFIVADETDVALLDTRDSLGLAKNLTVGDWYKLIKCSKGSQNNVVKSHKSFKPVKMKMNKKLEDIDRKVKEFEGSLDIKPKEIDNIDFEILKEKENNSQVDEVTIKVMSKSRVINTNRGNYQICTIKDYKGNKTSINLYSKFLDHLEPFKIFKLNNIRKSEITKNEITEMRLHTTGFTRIKEVTEEESAMFNNVTNGDAAITGELIGTGDITTYKSCQLHFTKLSDKNECPKCLKSLSDKEIINDYRLELYIEEARNDEESEANVVEILIFKRNLPVEFRENIDDKIEDLLNKKMRVDFNIDDASRNIAISINLLE